MKIRIKVREVYTKDQEGVPRKFVKGTVFEVIIKIGDSYYARLNKEDIRTYVFFGNEVEEISLTEMKMGALMIIIEKLIARHYSGEISLDISSFQLFELAKRFYFVEEEGAFQRILTELADFKK